jgi:hypothetical protein
MMDFMKPLANINISFQGSKMGSVTDQKGAFSFYIDTIPIFMIVSHLGYKTKRILLDGTSNSMTLYMERDIRELKEVEIRANRIEPFFKDEHYTLRDYEIDSGFVYLLVYRKDKVLQMIHAVGMIKFNDVLANCVASTEQVLFFKKMFNLGQGVQYYGIDRISKRRHELTQVIDEKKAKMLRRNPEDAWALIRSQPDYISQLSDLERDELDISKGELYSERKDFDNWSFTNKILYRPVKTALYKIDNFICIFNIPAKQLEFFDTDGYFSYSSVSPENQNL